MNIAATIGFRNNPSSKDPEEFGLRELEHQANRDEVVCLDFDGVLTDSTGPYARGHFGKPIREGFSLLRLLLANGYTPVILTARKETDLVAGWLAAHGFPGLRVTNHKEPAIAYVDDRAIKFHGASNGLDIFKQIQKKGFQK
jgi:hypothetical protein